MPGESSPLLFASALFEGVEASESGSKICPAVTMVNLVLEQASREVTEWCGYEFQLLLVPDDANKNFVGLWCSTSKRRTWGLGRRVTEKFLTMVVFEEGDVAGHVSSSPRDFSFADLPSFREALLSFFRTPQCGRVVGEVLGSGRGR